MSGRLVGWLDGLVRMYVCIYTLPCREERV